MRGRDGWDVGESKALARKKGVPAEKDEWNREKTIPSCKNEVIIVIIHRNLS